MTPAGRDSLEHAITAFLTDQDDPGVIVTRWIVVAEYASTSREYTNLAIGYSENISTYQVVGMCEWAKAKSANQWKAND